MDGMGSNSGWWDGKVDGMVYADMLFLFYCCVHIWSMSSKQKVQTL